MTCPTNRKATCTASAARPERERREPPIPFARGTNATSSATSSASRAPKYRCWNTNTIRTRRRTPRARRQDHPQRPGADANSTIGPTRAGNRTIGSTPAHRMGLTQGTKATKPIRAKSATKGGGGPIGPGDQAGGTRTEEGIIKPGCHLTQGIAYGPVHQAPHHLHRQTRALAGRERGHRGRFQGGADWAERGGEDHVPPGDFGPSGLPGLH